jgi:hypothetical protein
MKLNTVQSILFRVLRDTREQRIRERTAQTEGQGAVDVRKKSDCNPGCSNRWMQRESEGSGEILPRDA